MKQFSTLLAPALLAFAAVTAAAPTWAQTTVSDPWVRGTVAQQRATGMFAQITSAQGGRLLSASSPVAGVVEIHEMRMEGDVMRMRAIPGLDLPAGKPVALQPGGYHVMLMDLKQPLTVGEAVPVTLVFESVGRGRETVDLQVPVRALTHAAKSVDHKAGHPHKH